ncbi:MAG TPA: hypothetical protein ENH29_09820 [Bacteroidetes bacterium]|nr:hypothetical protein [Bacteroidota bacterium]
MHRIKLYPPRNNAFVLPDIQVSSATLFGALTNNYVLLHGAERFPELLQYIHEGLRLSCIFPALQIAEKEIFFLPKPFIAYQADRPENEDEYPDKKALKKLRWFSEGLLKRLRTHIKEKDGRIVHTLNLEDDSNLIIGGQFALTASEIGMEKPPARLKELNLFSKNVLPRAGVPRFGGAAEPFHQREISLPCRIINGKSFRLFFYYLEKNTPDSTKWQAVRELFAEEGIGGLRSLGKGYFEKTEVEEPEWHLATGRQMLLSDTIPQKQELSSILSYDFRRDDGFITFGQATEYKKSALYLIKAGAVLKDRINGRMVEEKIGGRTLYRYGLAMSCSLNGV